MKVRRTMKKDIFAHTLYVPMVVIIFLNCSSILFAQQAKQIKYEVVDQSHLWLNGSATLGSWSCGTGFISGFGIPQTADHPAVVRVIIKVNNLDCGNSGMNKDMYNAMNAETYPNIQYELLDVKRVSNPTEDGLWIKLQTRGNLTINNVTKEVDIPVSVRKLAGNAYQVVGSKMLAMSEFNITPPSAFFGLIKAHDDLEVKFDITSIPNPDTLSQVNK